MTHILINLGIIVDSKSVQSRLKVSIVDGVSQLVFKSDKTVNRNPNLLKIVDWRDRASVLFEILFMAEVKLLKDRGTTFHVDELSVVEKLSKRRSTGIMLQEGGEVVHIVEGGISVR